MFQWVPMSYQQAKGKGWLPAGLSLWRPDPQDPEKQKLRVKASVQAPDQMDDLEPGKMMPRAMLLVILWKWDSPDHQQPEWAMASVLLLLWDRVQMSHLKRVYWWEAQRSMQLLFQELLCSPAWEKASQ